MAKGGGGKLNKSEAVQVRFDPILKMAAELAAARERRTLSSYTEWAVEQAVKQSQVARDESGDLVSALQVAKECWSADAPTQLYVLSKSYPDLLTIRERKIVEAMNWVEQFVAGLGNATDMVRMLLILRGWADFGRYADDQITLEEVLLRLRNLRAALDKDGTMTPVSQKDAL